MVAKLVVMQDAFIQQPWRTVAVVCVAGTTAVAMVMTHMTTTVAASRCTLMAVHPNCRELYHKP